MSQSEAPKNQEIYQQPIIKPVDFVAGILLDSNLKHNHELGILGTYVERRDTEEFTIAFDAVDVLMRTYGSKFSTARELIITELDNYIDADVKDLSQYLRARPGCLIVSDDKYHHYIEKSVVDVQKIEATDTSLPQMGFITEDGILSDVYHPRCDITKLSLPEQRLLSFYV